MLDKVLQVCNRHDCWVEAAQMQRMLQTGLVTTYCDDKAQKVLKVQKVLKAKKLKTCGCVRHLSTWPICSAGEVNAVQVYVHC